MEIMLILGISIRKKTQLFVCVCLCNKIDEIRILTSVFMYSGSCGVLEVSPVSSFLVKCYQRPLLIKTRLLLFLISALFLLVGSDEKVMTTSVEA